MANIALAYNNLLIASTVSLASGTAEAEFPLYRLYDSDIGKLFIETAADSLKVIVDQGATGQAYASQLLIPYGHNLNGETCYVQHCDDNSSWVTRDTWVQGNNAQIERSWATTLDRYWRFYIYAPANPLRMGELYIGPIYEFTKNPVFPKGKYEYVFNVENKVTSAGRDRFIEYGSVKRQRNYSIRCDAVQAINIEYLYNNWWAGMRPLWLRDDTGMWIYGKFVSELNLTEDEFGFEMEINFLEVLP